MQIGRKIKALRLQKNLTQEELGERTDLSKGYISQLERDLNSPSIETLFSILEVLGSTPKDFFDDDITEEKIVYTEDEHPIYIDDDKKYEIKWLIPNSNEWEMEPVFLTLEEGGEFKKFEPSLSETFIYVMSGKIRLVLGKEAYIASAGNTLYFDAAEQHQLFNAYAGETTVFLVATNSYL